MSKAETTSWGEHRRAALGGPCAVCLKRIAHDTYAERTNRNGVIEFAHWECVEEDDG